MGIGREKAKTVPSSMESNKTSYLRILRKHWMLLLMLAPARRAASISHPGAASIISVPC